MTAHPILASTLWAATDDPTEEVGEASIEQPRASTSFAALDNALKGGFDYSSISCVSSGVASGHKALFVSVLAIHLLKSNHHHATVIDTTNSFDVRFLHARLVCSLDSHEACENSNKTALGVLDRVRIMKTFDFVGLTECIGELREDLEQRAVDALPSNRFVWSKPQSTTDDSEDEDTMPGRSAGLTNPGPSNQTSEKHETTSTNTQLLIIDNITQLAAPLLKNNHAQGQALLTSFMRSLGHLTRTLNMCTILLNAATAYKNSSEWVTPSVFSSCALQPALGKSFSDLADVHLLLHKVPQSAQDAQAVYGTQAQAPTSKAPRLQAHVVEVLQDRYSDRVGRWAAFQVDSEGRLKSIS